LGRKLQKLFVKPVGESIWASQVYGPSPDAGKAQAVKKMK